MKIIITLITLLLLQAPCRAQQNHVPNGDFETYTFCPTSYSQIGYCTGWRMYTTATSDYFNSCHTGNIVGFTNFAGSQVAAHGQGYAGGFIYAHDDPRKYKEYIATSITPLQPGITYEVSMSVSLAITSRYGTNDLGVYFYDSGQFQMPIQSVVPVTPQISYTDYGAIMNHANWTRLTKTFVADSAYDNIVIGGFSDNNNIGLDSHVMNVTIYCYYYIDSVVVKVHQAFALAAHDTVMCAGDTIDLKYFATNNNFHPSNTFTAQLSDAFGGFNNPVNIGSVNSDTSGNINCIIPAGTPTGAGYRLRIIASNALDTTTFNGINIKIGNLIPPEATTNNFICTSDTIKIFASTPTQGTNYLWTGPNGFTSTLQNPVILNPTPSNSGIYIVTTQLHGCSAYDTITTTVYNGVRATNVAVSGNSPICQGDTLVLTASAEGALFNYSWTGPIGFSSFEKDLTFIATDTAMSGKYTVAITNIDCIVRDTVEVLVNPSPEEPVIISNSPLTAGGSLLLELKNPKPGASFSWTGPDGFKSNLHKPYIATTTTANTGKYTLTTTIGNCARTAELEVIVQADEDDVSLVLYPNPNNGTFKIEGPVNSNNTIPVAIYAIMGQLIHKLEIIPVNKLVSENITLEGKLASGVYFVKLVVNGEARVIPMTVSR